MSSGRTGALDFQRSYVDCDALPHIPEGLSIAEHRKDGPLSWNANEILLWNPGEETVEAPHDEKRWIKMIFQKRALNASVLDHLLRQQHLIPQAWKDKAGRRATCVFFAGTIYRGVSGGRYVRCLYWHDAHWDWAHEPLTVARNFSLAIRPGS